MKILLISDYYPPHIKGGAEISTSLLANWLMEKGNEVSVICSQIVKKEWNENGINVYPIFLKPSIGSKGLFSAIRYAFGIVWLPLVSSVRILTLIRKIKPQIVNVIPSSYTFMPVIIAIRLFSKCSVVVDCRDYSIICPAHLSSVVIHGEKIDDSTRTHHGFQCFVKYQVSNKFLRLLTTPFAIYESLIFNSYKSVLKFLVNNYNGIYLVGVSQYVRKQLILNGFNTDKSFNIYNIAPEVLHAAENSKLDTTLTFVYAGRIEADKGIWDLISAAGKLNAEIKKSFVLKIAGTGEEFEQLSEYLNKHSMPNVHLLGKLKPIEILELYKEALAIVAPSRWPEPFGRFIIEATSVGKPLITTKSGGSMEGVKEGITGILVDVGDINGLADAMNSFIENPQIALLMKEEILEESKKYSADHIGPIRLELYNQLLNKVSK